MRESFPPPLGTGAMVAPGDVNHIGYSSCWLHCPVSAAPHCCESESRRHNPLVYVRPDCQPQRALDCCVAVGLNLALSFERFVAPTDQHIHAVVVHPGRVMSHATYNACQMAETLKCFLRTMDGIPQRMPSQQRPQDSTATGIAQKT